MKSPATKSTSTQKATWAPINSRIMRDRRCGSPPLSATAGFTPDARRAGASPNSIVTANARATPNPSTLQSAGRIRRAGLSGVPIISTIHGAAHQANPPPIQAAKNASHAHSTTINCTSRHRPAPIEIRSAISRWRAAAWAVIRLATFAHEMKSTRHTSTPRTASARPVISLRPGNAGKRRIHQKPLTQETRFFPFGKSAGSFCSFLQKRLKHRPQSLTNQRRTRARSQMDEGAQPLVIRTDDRTVLHHHRGNENIRHPPGFGAGKGSFGNAHHLINLVTRPESPPDHVPVPSETPLPVIVGEYGVRVRARL